VKITSISILIDHLGAGGVRSLAGACNECLAVCATLWPPNAARRTARGVLDFEWIIAAMSVGRRQRRRSTAPSRFKGGSAQFWRMPQGNGLPRNTNVNVHTVEASTRRNEAANFEISSK
jgi:hypothetical protein